MNKFTKTLLIAISLLNIAWFGGSKEDSEAKRSQNINEAIRVSRNFLFDNNTDKAVETLQECYAKYGESKAVCEALAYAYSQSKQYSSSAIYFEKAYALSANDTILLLNAGRAYEHCNAFESAISAYEKYLKIKPKDANVWKSIAEVFNKAKDYKKSLNAYTEFLKYAGRNPNTTEACEIGNLYLKLKEIGFAKAWLTSALGACNADNVEVKSSILLGLIEISLIEENLKELDSYEISLRKISPLLLEEKYPKFIEAKNALIEKENLKKEKILEELKKAQAEEEAKRLEETKKLEEEKLAAEAKAKEEAEKLAQKEAEEEAKKLQEAQKLEEEKAKQAEENSKIRAMIENKSQEEAQETQEPQESSQEVESKAQESSTEIPQEDTKNEVKKDEVQAEIAENIIEEVAEEIVLDELEVQIFECKRLVEGEEFSQAENLAHNLIAANPNSQRAWTLLAEIYQAQGMSIDAFLTSKQALAKNPKDLNVTLLYLQTGALVESPDSFLSDLIEANKKFPKCEEIVLGLARTFAYLGNSKQAKYFYEAFLRNRKHLLYREAKDEYEVLGIAKLPTLSMNKIAKDLVR